MAERWVHKLSASVAEVISETPDFVFYTWISGQYAGMSHTKEHRVHKVHFQHMFRRINDTSKGVLPPAS